MTIIPTERVGRQPSEAAAEPDLSAYFATSGGQRSERPD
jgi:hypothetical protein